MTIKLYDHVESGNCYKVRLLLSHLGIPFETEQVSVVGDRDAQRGVSFFEKNPIGKIPTVILEDGTTLGESTAICWWFAEGTPYLPDDRLQRVRVLQWMAFEQNNHEPNIATCRHAISLADHAPSDAQVAAWHEGGNRALRVMNDHLEHHPFFVADRYTIADIALFAYTHVADEGRFDLTPHQHLLAWLDRVREQPGFVPMR